MSNANRKRTAVGPVRFAAWALMAFAAVAFALGLMLPSTQATAADDQEGLAAAPLVAQSDHGAVKYGPWEIGSPNAADVTAAIYEDGTMVVDGTGDVVKVSGTANWRRNLGWTPSSGSDATEQMLAIKRVEFGDGVAPTSLNRWFWKCANLEYVNRIPSSVTDLRYAFNGCPLFVNLPGGFAIPQGANTGSMFTVTDPYSATNPLVTVCDSADYEALSQACNWGSFNRMLVFSHDPFDVSCTVGANASASDAALLTQTGVTTAMKNVVVAPASGYKIAAPTITPADAGVSAEGDAFTGWTVSGIPTANVAVTFADAEPLATNSVKTALAQNMSTADAALLDQVVPEYPGQMTRFTVAPAEGYKVPRPAVQPEDAGVSLSGDPYRGWTISGTPTANVAVTFVDAIAVESTTLYSEEGASTFNAGILDPTVVLKGAKVQAVYEGPCENQYGVGKSLYVALDPSTPPDETLALQASASTTKYGCQINLNGQGSLQLRDGAADREVQIALFNQRTWSSEGKSIYITVHLGLAGDPAFTPVVESSDASVGTADAQFVSNAGSSSVWKLTANVTNDWCTFDAFVDQNGKTYAADENGSVLVKVDQDGMRITARFKSAVDPLYNETDAESVTVAFTLSNDGVPLAGMDATPLARVEESIPYFDLSLYGLERYYRYHTAYGWGGYSDSQVVKRPTALHAYIWLAERYYLGLPAEDCGKGTSGIMSFKDDTLVSYFDATAAYRSGRLPAIVATQDPTSLYLSNFWGHDQNLMYYVNHAFPLMSKGVGATCDYVLLEDGDCIDMGLFSWWDFRLNGGFCQFDQDRYDINRGDKLDVRTLQASTLATADGSPAAPDAISTLKVALYDSNWNKVADLEGEGTYSYTFAQPGTYWLLATDPSAKDPNAACFAPAVAKVEVAGAPDRDENGTWLLGSADDMAWFQEWVNVKGHYDANAAITADIDMTSVEWTGLGETVGALYGLEALDGIRVDKAFAGVLDGRGHTLTVAFSAEPLCTLLTGTVKDLTITGTCSAPAAFTSCMSFGARLLNCVNQADVTGALPVGQSGERASAGIAVMVKDAYRVSMTEDTAMRIEGCVNKGSVSSSGNRAAGILGSVGSGMAGFKTTWGNMLTISGCSNEGVVSVADSRNGCVAGVVGTNSVQDCIVLENCSNAGEIVGGDANSAAGIVAHSETAIEQVISHCVNTGNITGAASYAGGILARGNGSASLIENCCNAGTISGHNAGGISSSNFSEIKNCYNLGDVKGSLTAGGIAAMHMGWQVPDTWSYIGAPVANCYTTGTVSGEGDVGAVFGKLYERGWEEAGYYSGTDYANVSAFWREGAAEAAIGAIGNACERFDTCEMRTAEQMHADAFAAELGDSFQTSCPYPVFAWQEAVDHSWDEGVVAIEPTLVSEGQRVFTCTVCGQTRAEVVPVADTSAIEEAIAAAKGIDASQLGEEQQQALAAAIAVAEAAAANNATTGSQLASALSSLELQAAKAEAAIAKAEAAAAQAAQAAAEKELEDAARAACEAAGTSYDEGKTPAENAAAAQSALAKAAADATAAQKAAETRADAAEKAAASGLKANTISVKAKTVKAKAKKKTVAKKAKAFVVKNAKGKVRFYKVKGHAKILVKQNGKVVVKKGLKAGKTYKVKVLVVAAGDKSHAPATKIVTCKVKVSKK